MKLTESALRQIVREEITAYSRQAIHGGYDDTAVVPSARGSSPPPPAARAPAPPPDYPTKKALKEPIEKPEFVRGQEQAAEAIADWLARVAEAMERNNNFCAGAIEDLVEAVRSGEWKS